MGSVSSRWTFEALKKYFKEVDNLDIKKIEVNLASNKIEVTHNGKPIRKYDCIYAKGSFRYEALLRSLTYALYNTTYMPIKPDAFTLGHDKILTHLELQKNKIPMPTTYISSSTSAAKKILELVNYPIIMKFPKGTQGKGVMFAESYAAAASMLDALSALKQPFLIQEFIETEGIDTRAIVVGENVVASMKRKAVKGEMRANIHAGGVGEPCELDYYTKKIAVDAAKAIGAEICAVDILEGPKGPLVIELNLSPGLQGITKVTKIDVADKIARYLFEKSRILKEKEGNKDTKKIFTDLGIESKKINEVITLLDFRGNRILLPQNITNITKFNDKDEVIVIAEKNSLSIKKFM